MPKRLIIFVLCCTYSLARAETWPPLTSPQPLTVEWVTKHVLIRYPEVHAKHRLYLAALERAARFKGNEWDARRLEQEAELARLRAVEHHLMLECEARKAFYDYWHAERAHALVTEQMRLWEAYVPAGKARAHQGLDDPRDFTLETLRLHATLLKLEQDRMRATWRLNALLDRRYDAAFAVPDAKDLTPLVDDRDKLLEETLNASPLMRKAQAEIRRADAIVEGIRAAPRGDQNLAAAIHELAGAQDQRRAVGAEVIREVLTFHDSARLKRDALVLYQQSMLPRTDQQVKRLIAGYQAGRIDIVRLLDAYEARFTTDLEIVRLRAEYEKALAELKRTLGRLPPEIEKKMAAKPLNIGGEVK